ITDINPNVEIESFEVALSSANAMEILRDYDLVVDGTDNFPTRYLVNDACVLLGKPNVYGSIFRFEGQASVFWAEHGPCYRCLFPEPPPPGLVPSCAEGGVLGVLPGVIGMIQATEAIKLILGEGEPLLGRLLLYDALAMSFRELKLQKDGHCTICSEHRTIHELIDYHQFCGVPHPGEEEAAGADGQIEPAALATRLADSRPLTLLDVRNPQEWDICRLDGARLIPLPELPQRLAELSPDEEIVVYCKKGIRGDYAREILLDAGFSRVKNLRGGILAWAEDVDPSVPRY
ncbi:MAG: ThiF family adenylyltransferase, partial [Candidatus Eisenbacteria bacterium]|nr:ThiF family adenylyltransferase [Candidatus Eisenbacteria bacterium]